MAEVGVEGGEEVEDASTDGGGDTSTKGSTTAVTGREDVERSDNLLNSVEPLGVRREAEPA